LLNMVQAMNVLNKNREEMVATTLSTIGYNWQFHWLFSSHMHLGHALQWMDVPMCSFFLHKFRFFRLMLLMNKSSTVLYLWQSTLLMNTSISAVYLFVLIGIPQQRAGYHLVILKVKNI
jgi:hypothetical protein